MKSPAVLYPTRVITNDPTYPHGKPRDEVTARDPTATPVRAAWVADVWGWMQALLASSGQTPDAVNESIAGSQLWTAMLAGQGVLSSRDPRWAALLVPGDDFDGSEALNLMAAELEEGGTLLILPAAGEATVDIPLVDTLSVPAGATLILGPGVTLVAGADEANTPAIELAADARLLGPGTVNCAADVQRYVLLSGARGVVDGVNTSSAVVYVDGVDCELRHVTGTGKLDIHGARCRVLGCKLAPTIIDLVCQVSATDVLVQGCFFHTTTNTVGSIALAIGAAGCQVTGTTLRAPGALAKCLSVGAADARVAGCTFIPGAGAAVSVTDSTVRFAGCAGLDYPQEPVRARGAVDAAGTLSNGVRIASTSRPGTGQFQVTFEAGAVANTNYTVLVDDTTASEVKITAKNTSGFQVLTNNSSGTAGNYPFSFVVLAH